MGLSIEAEEKLRLTIGHDDDGVFGALNAGDDVPIARGSRYEDVPIAAVKSVQSARSSRVGGTDSAVRSDQVEAVPAQSSLEERKVSVAVGKDGIFGVLQVHSDQSRRKNGGGDDVRRH